MRFNIFRRLIFSKVFTHDICIRISFFFFISKRQFFSSIYARKKNKNIRVLGNILARNGGRYMVYKSWWAIDFSLS